MAFKKLKKEKENSRIHHLLMFQTKFQKEKFYASGSEDYIY